MTRIKSALILGTCLVLSYVLGIALGSVAGRVVANFQADFQASDGSVIFWHDSFLVRPIYRHTGSAITHAAIVLDGYVYEAVPPRVHKVPLAEYKRHLAEKGIKWFMLSPKKPFVLGQVRAMRAYAESQLGRPYMLRGWWKGFEVVGIFCSQLVANTLERSGIIKSANFHESPGSLRKKLEPLYQTPGVPKG